MLMRTEALRMRVRKCFSRRLPPGKYEAFTSAYVLDELEQAPMNKRDKMLSLLVEYNISVLTYNDEAKVLADVYVSKGVIPQKYHVDGLHIALATVNNLDMIVSMNF